MALTDLQNRVCRLLAENRIKSGESYVAGGVALNVALGAPRFSRDVDIFHDSTEALRVSWERDRALLIRQAYDVEVIREAPAYVEAVVRSGPDAVLLQWVRDSAFRFFPLQKNEQLGLTLHPFDLATNKVLALVGRLEVRDWIDVIECSLKIQHLALLAWAACGKDPGFSPLGILTEAARSSHYTKAELNQLTFAGEAPDLGKLSHIWKSLLREAPRFMDLLPPEKAGLCLLNTEGGLVSAQNPELLERALNAGHVLWHEGSLGGVWPSVKPMR